MKKIRCIFGLHEGKAQARVYLNSFPPDAAIYRTCEYCGEAFDVHCADIIGEFLNNLKVVVSEDYQIHCGKFKLLSKVGVPHATRIEFDGKEIDCATSVNFFMDVNHVELKIGLEPSLCERK